MPGEMTPPPAEGKTKSSAYRDEKWLNEISFLIKGGTIPETDKPITPEIPPDIFEILASDEHLRSYFIRAVEHALRTISFEFYSKEESTKETAESLDTKLSAEELFKRAQTNLDTPEGKKLFLGRIKLYQEAIGRAMESVKEISKSRIDPLSGLYSKGRVEDELRREVAAYNRKPEEKEMIVLFIDGDEFKHYNDVYGHAVGDEIIKQMGRAIGASIRENDFAGRKGGDEFFVVLNNISLADIQSYTTIVERIQEAIAKINLEQAVKDANFYDLETDPQKRAKIEEDATKIKAEKLSITIGVTATANRSGLNAHQLFDESDQALYKAKHKQRGSVALAPVIAKLAAES